LEELAAAIARAFEVPPKLIGLNDPFKGGHITRTHGAGRVPWIQVEMNRCLYLDEPWFDRDTLRVNPGRLAELRTRFLRALLLLRL
jgi:formiminoglutamase